MKICILTIATNQYIQFFEKLYNNIKEHFLNGHQIECLLFTNHDIETSNNDLIREKLDWDYTQSLEEGIRKTYDRF
jgi:hypothetical protein